MGRVRKALKSCLKTFDKRQKPADSKGWNKSTFHNPKAIYIQTNHSRISKNQKQKKYFGNKREITPCLKELSNSTEKISQEESWRQKRYIAQHISSIGRKDRKYRIFYLAKAYLGMKGNLRYSLLLLLWFSHSAMSNSLESHGL